jgi:hypothetical protein
MAWDPTLVHLVDGLVPAGRKTRAVCTCGERTTPRASDGLAVAALLAEHGMTRPACSLCERGFDHLTWVQIKNVLVIHDVDGRQFLACRGMPDECTQLYLPRQAALDEAAERAAAELAAFVASRRDESPVRRRLRLVRGEG